MRTDTLKPEPRTVDGPDVAGYVRAADDAIARLLREEARTDALRDAGKAPTVH